MKMAVSVFRVMTAKRGEKIQINCEQIFGFNQREEHRECWTMKNLIISKWAG
jgi:hypothetical protein